MSAWTSAGLQPTTGYYPYDPALAAYGYVQRKQKNAWFCDPKNSRQSGLKEAERNKRVRGQTSLK